MTLEPSVKLEAVLAGAVSANQPEVHYTFLDYYLQPALERYPQPGRTVLNSSTDVTVIAAPTAGQVKARECVFLCIYNKDTASVTVTVKTDDGSTERILAKQVLLTTESLVYVKDNGWQVI